MHELTHQELAVRNRDLELRLVAYERGKGYPPPLVAVPRDSVIYASTGPSHVIDSRNVAYACLRHAGRAMEP